jgi:hypothetical protein
MILAEQRLHWLTGFILDHGDSGAETISKISSRGDHTSFMGAPKESLPCCQNVLRTKDAWQYLLSLRPVARPAAAPCFSGNYCGSNRLLCAILASIGCPVRLFTHEGLSVVPGEQLHPLGKDGTAQEENKHERQKSLLWNNPHLDLLK